MCGFLIDFDPASPFPTFPLLVTTVCAPKMTRLTLVGGELSIRVKTGVGSVYSEGIDVSLGVFGIRMHPLNLL